MRVSHRGSQALALGAGVAALLAIVAPQGYASSAKASDVPGLTFTKTVSSGPYQVGTPLTYTLTLAAAPAVHLGDLTDALPAGLVVQSVTTDDPGTTCTVSPATVGTPVSSPVSQTVTCPIGTIGNTSSLTITIVATPVDPGSFTNTATVPTVAPDAPATATATAGPITVGGQSARCFGFVPTQAIPTGFGPNTIDGTNGNDVIIGGRGNDTIDGEGGNDYICGDGGNDHLYGGSGDDHVAGGRGSDLVDGGAGHNVLRGGRDSIGFGPFTASTERRWHGDRDHDTLICQRGLDDCRSGFGDRDGFDGRDGRDGRHGRHHHGNRDRIIFVPERSFGDSRDGRDGRDFGPGPFSAEKGAPAAPHAKPGTKPAAKPLAKPAPQSESKHPAVAGTAPVSPKA